MTNWHWHEHTPSRRSGRRRPGEADTTEDRAETWLRLKREAAARHDTLVEAELSSAARRSWGGGGPFNLYRPPWQIVRRPDDVVWRAFRYLGTADDEDHRYYELG